jgi:type II restriction enzyme
MTIKGTLAYIVTDSGIFLEEDLSQFAHDQISEGKKRPDFLFPSVDAYRDLNFSAEKLRMLAAKTTCKDRWRQILSEAGRIPIKHLLTLQEGVSLNQFKEMEEEGVILVVPTSLHRSYPEVIRPKLKTLESFISETKSLYV